MKNTLLTVLLLIAINASAQTIYQAGYIVKNNNDTVKGFITYGKLDYTIQTVKFKTSLQGSQEQLFTPAELKSFFIAPYDFYLSYSGLVSHNKNHFPDIDSEKDSTKVAASLFLRQV